MHFLYIDSDDDDDLPEDSHDLPQDENNLSAEDRKLMGSSRATRSLYAESYYGDSTQFVFYVHELWLDQPPHVEPYYRWLQLLPDAHRAMAPEIILLMKYVIYGSSDPDELTGWLRDHVSKSGMDAANVANLFVESESEKEDSEDDEEDDSEDERSYETGLETTRPV